MNPFDPGANAAVPDPERTGPTSSAGVYHASASSWLLRRALEQARAGQLRPTWRQELTLAGGWQGSPVQEHATGVSDAQKLVLQEINEMPPAQWEPGHSTHWRQALDSWFVASRLIIDCQFADAMTLQVRMVASNHLLLSSQVRMLEAHAIATPAGESPQWQLIAGAHQEMLDDTRQGIEAVFVQSRDWLNASYLAGLAAGGTPGPDWRSWLAGRVERWPSLPAAANRVRIELQTPPGTHYLERLPSYWLGGAEGRN